jgi:hypothetical protein
MEGPRIQLDAPDLFGNEVAESLASLVEAKVGAMTPGSNVRIGDEYAGGTPYALMLDLREDDFDPASLDANLIGDAG